MSINMSKINRIKCMMQIYLLVMVDKKAYLFKKC